MKSYSPSQTKLFQQCPQEWWLSRKMGLRGKLLTKGDLTAAVGTHVGDAIENTEMGLKINENAFLEHLGQYTALEPPSKEDVNRYTILCEKALKAYLSSDLRPQNPLQVINAQVDVGIGHHCFIDMLLKDANTGDLYVWDTKCKLTCETRNVEKILGGYMGDWQQLHYGYFTWKKYGRVPKGYFIGLLGLQPTTRLHGGVGRLFPYTQEMLQQWYDSALFWWQAMEQCEQAQWAPMSHTHHRGWGRCEMFDVCFMYNGSVEIAKQSGFVQIERKVEG